jgi:TRAP-type mannitol/chloroaromatic compound transport system substrate-binding protein
MEILTNRINTASGGAIEATLHPTGSIIPSTEEIEGVDLGLVDYAYTGPAYWVDKWPASAMFSFIVGGLTGMEYIFWMQEGGGKELLHEMISSMDVISTGFMPTTPEVFLQSTRGLKVVDDLKGLKIRTAGDDGEIFTRMGASVVFLPGGEVYEALQRGVIDATQLSYPAYDYSLGIHEVVDFMYLSPVRQPTDPGPILFNKTKWNQLSPHLQEVWTSVVESEGIRYYARLTSQDLVAIELVKDYGITVEPASQVILDEMVKQAEIFYGEKAGEDAFYAKVLDSIQTYQKQIRDAWPRL